MRTCQYRDEDIASCPQKATQGEFCYYHAKIVDLSALRAKDVLTDTEIDTLFAGRTRNDGRRLDSYTRQKGKPW